MVTEFPLALLSEIAMGGDRDFDHYGSESVPPGYSNSTAARNGTQNGSGLSDEVWSDLTQFQYYPSSNLSTMLPQAHQLKKDWSSVPRANNGPHGGSVSVGGVLNQEEDESNRSSFNIGEKLVGLSGRDVIMQNDLGEIFQDPFSYPNPSPAAGLNPSILDANISASTNGSGSSASNNYGGSILGSPLSKNGLPDPEVAMRVPSPVLPPIGSQLNSINRRMTTNGLPTFNDASAGIDSDQVLSALSALNLQQGTRSYRNSVSRQADHSNSIRSYADLGIDRTVHLPSRNSTPLPEYGLSGMNMNGAPGLFIPTGNHTRTSPTQFQERLDYLKSIQSPDLTMELARKLHVSQPHAYCSDYGYLPGYPLGLAISSLRVGDHMRSVDSRLMRYPSVVGKSSSYPNHIPTTLLEEFKSNKTRCYELSEIVGHVVEFSSDQYGSRFIQQKLETATTQEKDMVFAEIMPHAITLMTDVFGNYVVQKFFEHGSAAQIKELAKQLNGRVLGLSLQMYGCRVIQKAIEVVDLEQKTQMVAELEHHVMRCVRDQNGNHVIQKCIECVPQEVIHFIISTFYGQVVVLSTHSYGCRVIQRVLEHCNNPKTQQVMMDEILDNVLLLSQDQYGNYVVQHVLQHGKPNEKSAIIEKLLGQIVNMSRQKFASNVVERCLAFGSLVERQMLIDEMLGPTEENEALQEMMKDQFGNYVVQRVLETCTDQQREMIMTRIKIHLTALKKYTYGKHIVARVEKLVTAGEKKLANQSGAYGSTA